MQFGGTADFPNSLRMYEACQNRDINFFDTAHTYTNGDSERYLGKLIGRDRERLIIATKTGYTGGSGRENIIKQFDESRGRLNQDMIDILYLHRWDPTIPLEETFETLADLQANGKFRYIGVSNFSAWQVMKAQAVAKNFGTRIDVLQPMYSLVKRQAEVEILPMALSENIAIVPYSPLGSGLLTGKYLTGGSGRLSTDKRYAARYGQEWMVKTAEALTTLAEDLNVPAATLAVAWASHHPAVDAPIISARDVDQLQASLNAADFALNENVYRKISALSPNPAPATDRLEEAGS